MVIQWLHRNWNTKNTHLLRCLLSFRNFHKPYQVLELIHFTMYLSQRAKNHMFENSKLGIHDCSGIKYLCSKYYLQILEEFHKKLSELQQCEYELKNNGRKWQWAGHVQKTIIRQNLYGGGKSFVIFS